MTEYDSAPRKDVRLPTDEELKAALPRGLRRAEFRVGAFVLLGLAALLITLFVLTDPSTFRGRYRISTVVNDAGGIRRGDPVQMKGVNIGRVQGFALSPDGVILTLELEGEWRVPEDSRTRLVSAGILGGRTVEVVPGESASILPAGGQLPGEKLDGLLDFPPELGQEAQGTLRRIQDLLAAPTLEAVQASAQELQGLLARLSRLAEAQGEEISRLTASLNRSALGVEAATSSGEDLARAETALLTVNRTSEALLAAASTLQTLLHRVEQGEGTLGQLSANPELYRSLNEAARSIRSLADDVRANPGRYVKIEIF
jgi:phospholipid/cholesterol/gamma-HCH transport system substrate-binding protein